MARQVFGAPISAHGRTIVLMAEVRALCGGRGHGGGGGRLSATPVGAIELNDDGVHIHIGPPETARAVVVALLLIGWNAFWIARILGRHDRGAARSWTAADTAGAAPWQARPGWGSIGDGSRAGAVRLFGHGWSERRVAYRRQRTA